MKNIAVLLMAGSGSRLNSKEPKQFIEVNQKPLFIYTLEKFISVKDIHQIILVVNEDKIELVKDILNKFNLQKPNIKIISGSSTRTKSLKNACDYLNQNLEDKDLFIITHDVARPLVSSSIIKNHLDNAHLKDSVINTTIKSNDSLSIDDNASKKMLDRNKVYKHQTPQSVYLKHLLNVFKEPPSVWENKTDLWDLLQNQNLNLINLQGDESNFKITAQFDLDLFSFLINKKI